MLKVFFNMCYKMNIMYTCAQNLHVDHLINFVWHISNTGNVKVWFSWTM